MRRIASGWLVVVAILVTGCSSDEAASPKRDTTAKPPASVAPAPSSGCRGGAAGLAAGEQKTTITSGGVERWYFRHVPATHDGTTPLPVVVDLHGYSEGAVVHTA